jgi:hypothetical protein
MSDTPMSAATFATLTILVTLGAAALQEKACAFYRRTLTAADAQVHAQFNRLPDDWLRAGYAESFLRDWCMDAEGGPYDIPAQLAGYAAAQVFVEAMEARGEPYQRVLPPLPFSLTLTECQACSGEGSLDVPASQVRFTRTRPREVAQVTLHASVPCAACQGAGHIVTATPDPTYPARIAVYGQPRTSPAPTERLTPLARPA